ncbi:MAG: flagellar biosynthesis protein FlhB [Hydrogenovibrio sp.]|uniref:flagellar biosynthesis protein FlhB n=1 Tax=Hydrogenovibrio sp. TaxID=2065821 RepID=UPI0028708906|nr:flagellar biosynthesis protein FlhB [Hydrogenovibrio sp.]MDR9499081.1 flagellar biosynthesis protein FlhB [Hydrogenovibrio sp.]
MAENQDGTEKTEEPTEKKLREAREKGDVARSRELTTFVMTFGAAVFLYLFGGDMLVKFEGIFKRGLSFDRAHAYDFGMLSNRVIGMVIESLWMIAPFLLLMVLIAIISSALLGGWNFSTQAMAPKLSKMNPLSGLKRMVSMNALMEFLKAFAKFTLVSIVAGFLLWYSYQEVLSLGAESSKQGLAHAGQLITEAFIIVSLALLVVAAIDVPFQMHQHITKLKMTKQEVKDEHKQQEGSPEVKARIRQVQRETAQKRMMQQVPEADVVITNPTHFAVALKYEADEMSEPVVVAMGSDFMAAQIRTLAQENDIPIVEAPPLARALYYNAEVDRPIPYDLFKAVATILAYVFQLKEGKPTQSVDFDNLPIPDAMQTAAPPSTDTDRMT